jgi:hypothetical protein
MQKLFEIKDEMLEEWTRTKRVSSQAAWVHQDLRK